MLEDLSRLILDRAGKSEPVSLMELYPYPPYNGCVSPAKDFTTPSRDAVGFSNPYMRV